MPAVLFAWEKLELSAADMDNLSQKDCPPNKSEIENQQGLESTPDSASDNVVIQPPILLGENNRGYKEESASDDVIIHQKAQER